MNNHIVYAGYYDAVCVYVGEGKPDRYKHLTSGVSHVYEANYFHHSGKVVEVRVLLSGLSKGEATEREAEMVITLKPLWNKACQFKKVNIVDVVEKKILSVFKRDVHLKCKQKQLQTIRQVAKLMDSTGVTRISSQQTKLLMGCPRIINRLIDEGEWAESKLIFTVRVIKSGLWEITLNE